MVRDRWSALAGALARAGALLGALSLPLATVHAQDGEPVQKRLEALEQEVALLKRQLEVKQEADENRSRDAAVVGAGNDGFYLRSPDRRFQLRLRGYAQFDSRVFGVPDDRSADTFSIRRLRPDFSGTLGEVVDFRILPDFAGGTATLFEAWANLHYTPAATLQFGKFKPPVGLERLQSATATAFVERGFPTLFVPNRDLGVQLGGSLGEGAFQYQIGAFNGVRDGGNAENRDLDTEDSKDLAGRIFFSPFANGRSELLRGLSLGVSGTAGLAEQAPASYSIQGATGFANQTANPLTFFSYLAGTNLSGGRTRVSPQLSWYAGPFGLLAEYVTVSQRLTRTTGTGPTAVDHEIRATNRAWQVSLSWVLTGENAAFGGVVPRSAFAQGGLGALELAARIQGVDFDGDLFPVFASADSAVDKALGFTLGVNWYLNRFVRLSINYDQVYYDGGRAAGRDRISDHQLLTRVQLKY